MDKHSDSVEGSSICLVVVFAPVPWSWLLESGKSPVPCANYGPITIIHFKSLAKELATQPGEAVPNPVHPKQMDLIKIYQPA